MGVYSHIPGAFHFMNIVRSVNLGGLFVLEPFISPALFQKYPAAVDEWTLSTLMASDTASGGLNQIEDHYNTFIVSRSYLFNSFHHVSCTSGRRNKTSRKLLELG